MGGNLGTLVTGRGTGVVGLVLEHCTPEQLYYEQLCTHAVRERKISTKPMEHFFKKKLTQVLFEHNASVAVSIQMKEL